MAGPLNAFVPDSNAHLPGSEHGPLSGLTFAAKDIFDIAGHATGCGNPHWLATHGPAQANAWVVQRLVDAGASMVGEVVQVDPFELEQRGDHLADCDVGVEVR